ncbi:MAG: hypothetical protein KC489_05765, partial [Gemmatimonadetes bacterium]|nr:hypothetical protein [Gemmatimonadota bacterium]
MRPRPSRAGGTPVGTSPRHQEACVSSRHHGVEGVLRGRVPPTGVLRCPPAEPGDLAALYFRRSLA